MQQYSHWHYILGYLMSLSFHNFRRSFILMSLYSRGGSIASQRAGMYNGCTAGLCSYSPTSMLSVSVSIANLDAIFAGLLRSNAGGGYDRLRLTGGGQVWDLTQIPDADLQGLEEIDLRGSGDNQLTLTVEEVRNLSVTTDTLVLRINEGDSVNYGAGWITDLPNFFDGEYRHQQHQGAVVVQVVSTRAWQNPFSRLDTNHDGTVAPIDVLVPINTLTDIGSRALVIPLTVADLPEFYYDSSGDGFVSPIDVLLVINFLIDAGVNPEGEEPGGYSRYESMLAAGPATSETPAVAGRPSRDEALPVISPLTAESSSATRRMRIAKHRHGLRLSMTSSPITAIGRGKGRTARHLDLLHTERNVFLLAAPLHGDLNLVIATSWSGPIVPASHSRSGVWIGH